MTQQLNERFFEAAKQGNLFEVKRLVALGADVNLRAGGNGDTVLIAAAYYGGKVDVVNFLIENGADLDVRNANDSHATALMCAAHAGHYDIVMALLEAGADGDITSSDGRHSAASFAKMMNHPDILELLQNPPAVSRRGPYEIAYFKPLSNRMLEEIFNFKSMERVSLLRKSRYGEVEAMTREQFSAIENSPELIAAFEEHVKRGGTVHEREVFPNTRVYSLKGLKS